MKVSSRWGREEKGEEKLYPIGLLSHNHHVFVFACEKKWRKIKVWEGCGGSATGGRKEKSVRVFAELGRQGKMRMNNVVWLE